MPPAGSTRKALTLEDLAAIAAAPPTAAPLLVLGEDLRVVIEVLRQGRISPTANTHRHVVQSLKERAADRMEALFGLAEC